jgi:hypothetical protein
MKTFLSLMVALLLAGSLFAQDNVQADNNDKKSKKEQKKALLEQQYQKNIALIESMKFVLEADFLASNSGLQQSVSNVLNYILVDSSLSILQVGQNYGMGANGVGGFTAKGTISKWKVDRNDKKKILSIRYTVSAAAIVYNVLLYLPTNGNANGTISGYSLANKVNYVGKLVPLENSVVFEGRSL